MTYVLVYLLSSVCIIPGAGPARGAQQVQGASQTGPRTGCGVWGTSALGVQTNVPLHSGAAFHHAGGPGSEGSPWELGAFQLHRWRLQLPGRQCHLDEGQR